MRAMKSNQYWINRSKNRMKEYHKDSNKTLNTITNAYDKAIKDIEEDIRKIFDKYALDGNLSPIESRRYLNQKIPNFILELMRKYYPKIKNEDIKRWMLSKINAPAYKARMTRLEALKESVYIRSKQIADVEIQASTRQYINTISQAYYRNMFDIQKGIGMGFEFATMPSQAIETILKNPWSGKQFSERIWNNTDILAEQLTEILTSGFMTGKSIDKMARELRDITHVGKYVATRLIRTETTYMANAAEIESYKECGIEKYIYIATLDLRTSKDCRELDRQVFEVLKAVAGENLPPMHPNCRSTTRAYLGPDTLKNIQRRARNPKTGKTYLIPADMNYEQWYQKYVIDKYGKDQAKAMEKKIKNKASDKKQHEKYKEIIGKDTPKSFDKFQELKYNNSEEWNIKQREYSTIKTIKNKDWSDSYKEKIKNTYYDFREDGIELSWHGTQRFVDRRVDKKGNTVFTKSDITDMFNGTPNYIQEDGRLVNFQNGTAIIRNSETNEIISIVIRKNPKKEWIRND